MGTRLICVVFLVLLGVSETLQRRPTRQEIEKWREWYEKRDEEQMRKELHKDEPGDDANENKKEQDEIEERKIEKRSKFYHYNYEKDKNIDMQLQVQSMGCFEDSDDYDKRLGRIFNDKTGPGTKVNFDKDEVYQKCFNKAKRMSTDYFGIQNGKECWTSRWPPNYDNYGRESGCRDGRGGSWRMNMYRIKLKVPGGLWYERRGCYNDHDSDEQPRAISGGYQEFPGETVIEDCFKKAKAGGFSHFAIESGNQCFTSATAGRTFHKYGQPNEGKRPQALKYDWPCGKDGKGGNWKMDVYEIVSAGDAYGYSMNGYYGTSLPAHQLTGVHGTKSGQCPTCEYKRKRDNEEPENDNDIM